MSNPTPEPTVEPNQPAEPPAQETDWKAEARKWEARAKQNSDAAQKLADIEEASKTEAQKLADKAASAEARVKALEQEKQVRSWAAEVAKDAGVPVEVLRGDTREALEAHAAQLKALMTPETPQTPTGKVGPYVPLAGQTPGGPMAARDQFAAFLQNQIRG